MKVVFLLVSAMLFFGCAGQMTAENQENVVVPEEEEEVVEVQIPQESQGAEQSQEQTEESALDALSQEDITYRTSDSWDIEGTLYHAQNERPSKMIILVHMLGGDRSDFDGVIVSLHQYFPDADVFALDLRGHGESTNKKTWENFESSDFRSMKKDVLESFEEFEILRPDVEDYYLVGASIGSSVAIEAAVEDSRIRKVVMISPGTEYHGIDISESGSNYQRKLCIAVAHDDEYSYVSAQELYENSPSDSKVLKKYSGSAHGTELFSETKDSESPLIEDLTNWLKTG